MKKLLYIQIKEDIHKKINDNFFKPGERLPSEPELAKEFNISRPTLREALKMLQREGVLVSKNGVGTYVNNKTSIIENPLSRLQSLGEMIKNAGYKDSESDVKIYFRDAEREWKEKLSIDEKVLMLERTRTADGRKVAFYYNIIPIRISGEKFSQKFSGGIFDFLERNIGIKIAYSITEICSVSKTRDMDKKAIDLLGPDILLLKQLHFDENNKPVFYSLDFLKNEVFRLFIKRE
jgi:GntR family transcriptional regulator